MSVEIKFLSFLLNWYAIMDPKTFTLSLKKKNIKNNMLFIYFRMLSIIYFPMIN